MAHGLVPGRGDQLAAVALLILTTMAVLGAEVVANGRGARTYELWALYQGLAVCLIISVDPRSFNQICRAFQRSLERRRDQES